MKRIRKKSYYSKVFFGLLLVLLVAVVTIISIFLQAKTTIEDQILKMNQDTLTQSLKHVDEVIKSGTDTAKSIVFSTQYNSLSRRFVSEPERHAYLAWALQQQLSAYANETFLDVFVYYPKNGYAISAGNGFALLENYYQYHYAQSTDSWEDFYKIANSPNKRPAMYSFDGKAGASYQCVTLRAGYQSNSNVEYVVVVVLNQQYMKMLLREMDVYSEGRGHFFIINEDQKVMFCSEKSLTEQASGIYQDTDEVYKRYIGDTPYMVLSQPSSQMDVYYAYAVSYDYFWSELYEVYVIFLLGILAMVVLGGWIVFWQTRQIYRPVEQTVTKLLENSNSQWDVHMHTELELIEEMFHNAQQEKNRLNRVIKRDARQKRDAFILSLFEGDVPASETSEDVFAENDIQLCSDYFCVALLKMEKNGDLDKNLLSFAVSNVLEELLGQNHRGYVITIDTDRYAVLINMDGHDALQSVEGLIEQGLRFWEEHFNVTFTVGISTQKQGMSGVCDAYAEAVSAMKYRYLLGTEKIIRYMEIQGREFKWPQKDRMTYAFNDFMTEENCDIERAEAYVDECLQKYHINADATLDMVECFVFEVVNNFNRYLSQMEQDDTNWKEQVKVLPQSETLVELRGHFIQLLMRVYLKVQDHEKENDICARAKSYVESHYQDVNLSLAELATIFGLTSSYFSKMFKEKYKVSIPDYINLVRINQAKKLLSETSESVQVIASAVGFTESSTFIRVFKKTEGITPGVYRSLGQK